MKEQHCRVGGIRQRKDGADRLGGLEGDRRVCGSICVKDVGGEWGVGGANRELNETLVMRQTQQSRISSSVHHLQLGHERVPA